MEPLGYPVVPEVYIIVATSSGLQLAGGRGWLRPNSMTSDRSRAEFDFWIL